MQLPQHTLFPNGGYRCRVLVDSFKDTGVVPEFVGTHGALVFVSLWNPCENTNFGYFSLGPLLKPGKNTMHHDKFPLGMPFLGEKPNRIACSPFLRDLLEPKMPIKSLQNRFFWKPPQTWPSPGTLHFTPILAPAREIWYVFQKRIWATFKLGPGV